MVGAYQEAILVFFSGIVLVLVVKAVQKFASVYLIPIRYLRGPSSEGYIRGNIKNFSQHLPIYQKWVEEYGNIFLLRGPLQMPILFTTDMRTINHVLTHSMNYHKTEIFRRQMLRILGNGILFAEGEKHRQQRRVMNPAFGPAQIQELTEIFLDKANELCEYWRYELIRNGDAPTNVMDGRSKMTLDVIGLAGFNYDFKALNANLPQNELNEAFSRLSRRRPQGALSFALSGLPFLHYLSGQRGKKGEDAHAVMQRIARQIVQEKKAAIMSEYNAKNGGAVEKNNLQGRDIITLLLKANMATDIPESQRMTDDDVLAQIPTFLVAGHETTSTATTWCLYSLVQAPQIQQKLREELLSVETDVPSMEDLQALPYLDQVVRETLRLHAPVAAVFRVAMKDDVLPVSAPFSDKHGNVHDELSIAKGTSIIIPIMVLHTSRAIWGDDAFEFKPERWLNPPEASTSMPGVWGHLLTFIGGPHACIGYRFSLVEMKALLFVLIRTFEFDTAVPKEEIIITGRGAFKRPSVRSEPTKGVQLPLIIRPVKRS